MMKMKVNKKIAAASAMLMLSATMLGTSTFAWFTMNREVTVNGMQVQARAEAGILVSNAADGDYDETAASAKDTIAELYPGSTSNLEDWFHSSSGKSDTANTQHEYEAGTAWTANTSASTRGNYVVHDFYLKSSKKTDPLSFTKLVIKDLHVLTPSQNLTKALRVGVKIAGDSNAYIFSPTGGQTSYSVTTVTGAYAAANMTTVSAISSGTADTTITSLPDIDTNAPVHVQVFIWYEGEDANCISDNVVASLESVSVDMTFEADGLVQN